MLRYFKLKVTLEVGKKRLYLIVEATGHHAAGEQLAAAGRHGGEGGDGRCGQVLHR